MLQVFSAYFFRTMREGFAGKFRSAAAQALCSGVMKLECGGPGRNWRIGKLTREGVVLYCVLGLRRIWTLRGGLFLQV